VRETAYNYTEQREMLRWDFGTRNSADNISDIDDEFFFIKKSHNKLLEKLT
jgi:hypothetical protein